MAKELPYFKFEPSAWDSGNIQMCSRESKGLFIELCSIYWNRLGELPHALALQKLCNGNNDAMQELIKHQIIGIINEHIIIQFLDEQLSEFKVTSEKRREAANKRWNDANALQLESKSNASREEESREEEKKVSIVVAKAPTIKERSDSFYSSLIPFITDYGKTMVREFFDYWSEISTNGKKMRFEKEKAFDISKRLARWKSNQIAKGFEKTETVNYKLQ